MPARGGDLKGALDVLLPLDVGKIRQRTHILPGSRRLRGLYLLLAAQMAQQLAHVLHRVYGYILGKGGFVRVLGRDKHLTHTLACRGKRHRQRTLNRAQLTEQGQLADKGRVAPGRVNVPRGGKDADEYRQVIDRPGFLLSAGARFTVSLLTGKRKPLFFIAARTRSRASLTAASGSPTMSKPGSPFDMYTSTSTP